MRRWRSHNCPPKPRAWEHYVELLRMQKWRHQFTTYSYGELTITDVRATDGSVAVVFGDMEYLRSIHAARFFVDATFSVCPRMPRVLQFLTIMAEVDGCVIYSYPCTHVVLMFVSMYIKTKDMLFSQYLPIAWALMERKSTVAYLAVMRHFATILAPQIRPSSCMMDFETSLAAAVQII